MNTDSTTDSTEVYITTSSTISSSGNVWFESSEKNNFITTPDGVQIESRYTGNPVSAIITYDAREGGMVLLNTSDPATDGVNTAADQQLKNFIFENADLSPVQFALKAEEWLDLLPRFLVQKSQVGDFNAHPQFQSHWTIEGVDKTNTSRIEGFFCQY